ncbi:hypothetical protein [Afifella sp. IM 167]|uniref:hypothetical protein n=1 Tax=Afifella sp. IM 167 TaxID=2033586 RepID=UPI001CCB78EE|nr:hypothetical protein [Afifella sp. IM 167]MBZ8133212.1 hypothetical protein [Afifella sp. IM 167]
MCQWQVEAVRAGKAMWGQILTQDGMAVTAPGSCQLWNPWGSGRNLLLTRALITGMKTPAADVRVTRRPIGPIFADHAANKKLDGPDPVGELRWADYVPSVYPENRPRQEIWQPTAGVEGRRVEEAPFLIPQGYGIAYCSYSSGDVPASRMIASLDWIEEEVEPAANPAIPTGSIIAGGLPIGGGGIAQATAANAFDGLAATYASGPDATNLVIGIDYGGGNERAICGAVVTSPPARSFAGSHPPRIVTAQLQVSPDAATWTTVASEVFQDSMGCCQTEIAFSVPSVTARAARIEMAASDVSGWRIGAATFFAPDG